jgi:hypothetical protein
MMSKRLAAASVPAVALLSMLAFAPAGNAASVYFSDFNSATDLSPWLFFSDNAGLGNYSGTAPSAGPQISSLVDDGGNKYINFYANYANNAVHGGAPGPERISLYVNQTFSGAEAASGATWYFNFDFAENPTAPVTGATQVGAFIRVFDGAFNLLAEQTLSTLNATAAFQSAGLEQALNPLWSNGGIIQFGFNNAVDNYEGSGRFYDNVRWDTSPVPAPPAVWLAVTGFAAAAGWARRRRA